MESVSLNPHHALLAYEARAARARAIAERLKAAPWEIQITGNATAITVSCDALERLLNEYEARPRAGEDAT